HDWCISRQLWWGHRVPAWYCQRCDEISVSREDLSQCPKCGAQNLRQDADVLDTWFSSALWPFSTLGWPKRTRDLQVFYPTSLMITGFDILFFWVARMMMMGLEFMGDVPFRLVYIHQLVRDAEKQKMSKTRGNVIDPLVVTEQYGTDAVRFTLAIMASPGTDIALSTDRMEGYRAFANKIWNAARFISMSLEKSGAEPWKPPKDGDYHPITDPDGQLSLEDRWIFSRLSRIAGEMTAAWEAFRYHEAAHLIYHFFWHEFCDWYLELKKLTFAPVSGPLPPASENLCRAFDIALRLLHPMMPFITEELWQRLSPRQTSVALSPFPAHDPSLIKEDAEEEMKLLQDIIVNIRNMRAELGDEARQKTTAIFFAYHPGVRDLAEKHRRTIERLANLSDLTVQFETVDSFAGAPWRVVVPAMIDVQMQRGLLQRQEKKLSDEMAVLRAQLENQQFLSKASLRIVAERRKRMEEVVAEYEQVVEWLHQLG
ncbi:MAG: class I tRNA ligase family protein, partial [Acidobacteria bacterium]|nr:class I tRNA ligase family protein [Acidobacteriota bacterium]